MRNLILAGLMAGFATAASAAPIVPPAPTGLPVIEVQSADSFRINDLEEQVRRLTGTVEELNFLLLQLQEKVRKMEEDNEQRFQDLEEKSGSLSSDENREVATAEPAPTQGASDSLGKPEAPASEPTREAPAAAETPVTEPRAPGTLTFDDTGNVLDSVAPDTDTLRADGNVLPPVFGEGQAGAVEASRYGATPDEVLAKGRDLLAARDYPRAQKALAAHILAWPEDPRTGEAYHHLGDAMFWQRDYYQAAEMHLKAHNEHPQAATAPDNLLALGLALAGLNQREVACATYAEVLRQYPDAAARLGPKVRDEQAAAKCGG